MKENEITQDTYYLVKHIIRGVVKAVPEIKNFLSLQKKPIFTEFLMPATRLKESEKLQSLTAEHFVKFCKILLEIKIDFNVVIFVAGIHNLFKENQISNFIYILRSAGLLMPPFLKIILTADWQ